MMMMPHTYTPRPQARSDLMACIAVLYSTLRNLLQPEEVRVCLPRTCSYIPVFEMDSWFITDSECFEMFIRSGADGDPMAGPVREVPGGRRRRRGRLGPRRVRPGVERV